jgi:hypothetical protein
VAGDKLVKVYGLPPVISINPVEPAVGAGEPVGKANTCQAVSVFPLTQLIVAEVDKISDEVNKVGSGQVGKSSMITLSI